MSRFHQLFTKLFDKVIEIRMTLIRGLFLFSGIMYIVPFKKVGGSEERRSGGLFFLDIV